MKKIFILILLFCEIIIAKPFYLTVRRDFSPNENPVVELNYSNTEPFYIRILEPKDMKSFIATQIDLRRAWKEPKNQLNPAHFLNLGYNYSESNFDWIRNNLSYQVKKDFVHKYGGSTNSPYIAPTAVGPEKIISVPEGFSLLKEIVLNPEQEDKNKPFDVPGFESYFDGYSYGSNLKTKILPLPKLKKGFYVIQVMQGDIEGQVVLVVNDILAQLQHSGSTLIYRVAKRTGEPIKSASVSVRSLNGVWVKEGKTDENGVVQLDGVLDSELLSVVQSNEGTAIIDSEYFATTSSFSDLYLYTDRPLYRNGDTVNFKGILRNLLNGKSITSPSSATIKVELQSIVDGKISNSKSVKFTEFGTFTGSLEIDGQDNVGLYRVVASLKEAKSAEIQHSSEIRIKEYVKPIYFITVQSDKEIARLGDKIKFSAKAERYAGGAPNIQKAEVTVFRTRMESDQWIEDSGAGETGSESTYGDDPNKGKKSMLPEVIVPTKEITFNKNGQTEFEVEIPKELPGPKNLNYKYRVEIFTQDVDSNFIYGSKNLFDLASEVQVAAKFNKILSQKSSEAQLNVQSLNVLGGVYPDANGTVEFILIDKNEKERSISKKSIKTNSKGKAQVDLPELKDEVGELKAIVTLMDKNNNSNQSSTEILISGNQEGREIIKVNELRILANKNKFSIGEKIKFLTLLPNGWGVNKSNKGLIYLTLASNKVFAKKVLPVNGNSFWLEESALAEYGNNIYIIISYVDSVKGWTEKRAQFKIFRPELNLTVNIKTQDSNVIPGSPQKIKLVVLDKEKKPVKAELSVSVVDRAVLDLQPEFRPTLIDFFYPISKLNLMTFLSSHFQGYGYGEKLAQLFNSNHVLAASKNQSKPLDVKDTAYWNGRVLTNEKGEAEVNFNLPGNQTIWRITAVAVDNQGRFGESTNEFKSQLPVTLLVGFPNFMRANDTSRIRVNISATQTTQEMEMNYSAQPEDKNLISFVGKSEIKKMLKPREQFSDDIEFKVNDVSNKTSTHFIGNLKFGKSDLKFKDAIKLTSESSLIPEYLQPENNEFKLALSQGEAVAAASITINKGLASTMLPLMNWMVRYPYGCAEQTVSALMSNIVVRTILSEGKNRGLKLDENQLSLLKQSEDYSASGHSRLMNYQMKTGGFKWFMDTDSPDLNMTLMVLTVLASTHDYSANLYNYRSSYDWLSVQKIIPASPQGVAYTFIESRMAKQYVINKYLDEVKPNLKLQIEYVLKSGTLLEKAMLLTAIINYRGSMTEFKNDSMKIAQSIVKDLQQMKAGSTPINYANFVPLANNGWSNYPGKATSAIALAYKSLRLLDQEIISKSAQSKKGKSSVVVSSGLIDNTLKNLIHTNILAHFNGDYFDSTFDSSLTVLSVADVVSDELIELSKMANSSSALEIYIADKKVESKDLKISQSLGGINIELLNAPSLPLDAKISVKSLNPADLLRMKLSKKVGYKYIKPSNNGWEISKKYFKVSANGQLIQLKDNPIQVEVGDLVYTEIKFNKTTETSFWKSRYYMLTEDLPAGLVPIQEDQTYQIAPFNLKIKSEYKVREFAAQQVRWYFDFSKGWMDQANTVGVVYRAQYPGEFSMGIAKIMDFYDENKTSYTHSNRIIIKSK